MALKNGNEKIKIALVDVTSKAENEARDLAESKMTANKEELKGFSGFCTRIWKHNLFRGYYKRKEYDQAREKILSQKNLYANEGENRSDHEQAMQAIASRFMSEYEDAVHLEAGETKEKLGDSPIEKQVKAEIEKLVKDYALVDLSDQSNRENFENEKNRILSGLKGVKKEVVGKGDLFADNLFEAVKQVQHALEHGKKLHELDLDFDVVIGRAKDRVRTEAQYNAVDRMVEKITSSKVGCYVNEATLASALSLAYCAGGKVLQSAARSRLLQWATFGATALLGAGVAAARESQVFEEERKRHFRDVAQGKKFDLKSKPRRQEMESLRHETIGANDLADNLEKEMYVYGENGERRTRELSKVDIQNVLNNLAEIESRITLSDRMKIDLIGYSSAKKAEQEGLRLDLLRGQVKADLEKHLRENPKMGYEILKGNNLRELTRSIAETRIEQLTKGEQGIEEKNKQAKAMKRKKVAWAAVKGLGVGLFIGAAAQEMFGSGEGLYSQMFGVKEAHVAGAASIEPHKYTALGYFYRWMSGNWPRMDMQEMQDVAIGKQHFNIPRGASLLKNPDGTLRLLRGDEIMADGISVDAKGQLTAEGRALLENNDVKVKIAGGAHTGGITHEKLSPRDYIEKNKGLFQHIKRTLWYDNDTPKPVFDKNELKLWWGGKGGTGIDANGKYVFNVKHMVPKGSYHASHSVNAQEAMKSGKLKMLLSLSRDTQCDVVEVPIDANGNMVVDPNSDVGKMFFKSIAGKNGPKAVFTGKFAEVAQMMGNKGGSDHVRILATHIGKGLKEIPIEKIPPIIFDLPAAVDVEPPPFIPIFGRRPLERRNDPMSYLHYYNYCGYGGISQSNKEIFNKRLSKTLKEKPDAELDHHEEIERYLKTFSGGYREKIEGLAKQAGTMPESKKLSICIPVAGHQEGKNIYISLENYSSQTADSDDYEIVLFVNHPEQDRNGNKIYPDETLKEIERFRKKYPQIDVKIIYSVLPIEEAKIGKIRKILADIVLLRQFNRGKNAKDLIMISNDADNKGIAPQYVKNFINKFEKNPQMDGYLGQLDWDPESYVKYPLIHIGTRLFQYLSVIGRHRSGGMVSSGANFGFRSSILAATGGYVEDLEGGEDIAIGQAIINARGSRETMGFAGARVSRLYTSARRAIDALRSGLSPVEQWYKGFSAFDDEVRRLEMGEGEDLDFDDPAALGKFRHDLEIILNRTLDEYEKGDKLGKDHDFYKKALGWLGIKYQLDSNGNILITDMNNLISGLKQYQIEGVRMRDRKSGK